MPSQQWEIPLVPPLVPARRLDLASSTAVQLPIGGIPGVGTAYNAGMCLGYIGGAPTAEVQTLTITGSPTGFNGNIYYFTPAQTYAVALPNLVSTIPTQQQMQVALQQIFGTGNVTVTKSSLVYTLTWAGQLSAVRVGGLFMTGFSYTGGSGNAAAFAVSTYGSCGAAQADIYTHGSAVGALGTCSTFLMRYFASDAIGGVQTQLGDVGPLIPAAVYTGGFFRVADLASTGNGAFDSYAASQPNIRLVEGANVTDPGAIIGLGS